MNKKEIKKKYKLRKRELCDAYDRDVQLLRDRLDGELDAAREEYFASRAEYYRSIGKEPPKDPPKRGILEEIGNAVTHGAGSLFAIVAFILMLRAADAPIEYVAASVYFFGLFVMFTMSCLYHAFPHGSAVKRLFRRFDYSSIYLLIGATFAPALLCVVGGSFGIVFFSVQWAIIAFGITFVGVFGPTRFRMLHIPLYVILGWSALMLLPSLISASMPLAMWILAGGIVYSVGIIPFAMKARASHFIWHFFVLAGALVQWVGIYLYIY